MVGNALSRGDDVGEDLVPITPTDTNGGVFPNDVTYRAIRCKANGTAGTLRFKTVLGTTRNTYIAQGETLFVAISGVMANGTTADGLEGYV